MNIHPTKMDIRDKSKEHECQNVNPSQCVWMIFTLERLSKMPFPFMLRRRRQWLRWCLSKVEVEYSLARGLFLLRSKVLFVPRWSKSWQMHATSIPKISAYKYIICLYYMFVLYVCKISSIIVYNILTISIYRLKFLVNPVCLSKHTKHHLRDVERMIPVMVLNSFISIVSFDC